MKYIGIVGSRRKDTHDDFNRLLEVFIDIYKEGDIIVSGGCKQGGDRFAEIVAKELEIEPIIHLPNKADLDPYLMKVAPRAAYAKINYARNTLIAKDSDVLIAMVADDRNILQGGVGDTIKKFVKMKGKGNLIIVL